MTEAASPLLQMGRTGVESFGEKVQDAFLKQGDKQGMMVDLLQAGLKKQDELIQATKEGNQPQVGLLG